MAICREVGYGAVECHVRAMPTPSADDGPRFHSYVPVSELAERDPRAIESSVVSSAPPVGKTVDRVMHETRPTPTEPHGARRLEPPDPNSGIDLTGVRRPTREGPEATSRQTEPGEKTQMSPVQPSPSLPRSGQGHLNLLVRS